MIRDNGDQERARGMESLVLLFAEPLPGTSLMDTKGMAYLMLEV